MFHIDNMKHGPITPNNYLINIYLVLSVNVSC